MKYSHHFVIFVLREYSQQTFKVVPIIMPSAIDADALSGTLPSSVGGTHELLLTNRICQRWSDVLYYVYTLQKIVTHLAKRLCLSLAGFEDTGCHEFYRHQETRLPAAGWSLEVDSSLVVLTPAFQPWETLREGIFKLCQDFWPTEIVR